MIQLPMFGPTIWTVTQLTRHLRDLLENDEYLQDVWIQGEVSNLSRPSSGHLYFTVKDNTSALKCVMWRNSVLRQAYIPRDGDAIEVHGSVSIYETAGQYQLYADLIRPAGEGLLFQEFLRLKGRLEAEGLFAEERKRPIPPWPHTIGIVTSPTGAAPRDILNTIRRRFPAVRVILAPTTVQGEEAPAGIVAALEKLNNRIHPDVIILARGGGSIEDLWPFNDERVARAVAASLSPVITGVGHETDFTIVDFVSDLRAPTPTAAAELATPNRIDLRASLSDTQLRIVRAAQTIIQNNHWQISRLENRLRLQSPEIRIRSGRQRIDDITHRVNSTTLHIMRLHRAQLSGRQARLASLNPQAVLNRGYALLRIPGGNIIQSIGQVMVDETLEAKLKDGRLEVQVKSISRNEDGS
ncbi:MAG: xseA [Chloroflexi bacterium]|nr:xseA [Chloroflexota bacterium]